MEEEIRRQIELATDPKRFGKIQKNGLFLNDEQIAILERNHIPWKSTNSLRQLLFYIEETLMEQENEELEQLSLGIQEQSYYNETRK